MENNSNLENNNSLVKKRFRLNYKQIIILILILAVIFSIIYLFFIKKTKAIYVRTNVSDYQIHAYSKNDPLPIPYESTGKNQKLDLEKEQYNLVISKDGYLDKYVSVSETLPINLVNINLIPAEINNLSSVIDISSDIVAPNFPVITNSSDEKNYYFYSSLDGKIYKFYSTNDENSITELITVDVQDLEGYVSNNFDMSPNNKSFLLSFVKSTDQLDVLDKTIIINSESSDQTEIEANNGVKFVDDKNIIYLKKDADKSELIKKSLVNSSQEVVCNLPQESYNLTISPDKKFAGLVSNNNQDLNGIIVDLTSKKSVNFSLEYQDYVSFVPKWSPNSQKIAYFNNNGDTLVFDTSGKKTKQYKNNVYYGTFIWGKDSTEFYYLEFDSKKDMPFIVKNDQGKLVADFIYNVNILDCVSNNLVIQKNNQIIRIDI